MTQERLDLPQLQTRLLVNALRSVRVGGSVVYSTCTLSPSQNEAVVENAAVLAQQHVKQKKTQIHGKLSI
jgi:16S rRNA C967 or C1407 C5-methylase (RsmB/RsmF family)